MQDYLRSDLGCTGVADLVVDWGHAGGLHPLHLARRRRGQGQLTHGELRRSRQVGVTGEDAKAQLLLSELVEAHVSKSVSSEEECLLSSQELNVVILENLSLTLTQVCQ